MKDEVMKDEARATIVTYFGAGLIPGAPGTWGSLLAILMLWGMFQIPMAPWTWNVVLVGWMIVASGALVALGPWAIGHFGKKDPGPVVLDEVAGICVTLLGLPMTGTRAWVTFLAAFAAFRVFDVLKPPPIRRLEKFPAGWGILVDDLMAGVYANILCQIVLRFFIMR